MSIEVNGVILPDIPVVEGCSYAAIVCEDNSRYLLFLSNSQMYLFPKSVSGHPVDMLVDLATVAAQYESTGEAWTLMAEQSQITGVPLGDLAAIGATSYALVWSNHDVATITWFDSNDDTIFTTGEIYFQSSVTKRYTAPRTWFESVANKTRNLTGTSDTLTIDTMQSGLDSVSPSMLKEYVAKTSNSIKYSNSRLTSLGNYAFYNDLSLQELDLPNVKTLPTSVCDGAQNLTKVNIPNLTRIGSYALRNTGITEVYFPKLTEIGSAAALSPSVYVFNGCTKLTKVDLPELTAIAGNNLFSGCTSLVDVNLPKLKTLGIYSVAGIAIYSTNIFANCKNLEKLDFPMLTAIHDTTFYGCLKLTTLILRSETLCTLEATSAFNNTPIKIMSSEGYIYVPSALIDSYKAATNWSTFATKFRAIEDYPDICGE